MSLHQKAFAGLQGRLGHPGFPHHHPRQCLEKHVCEIDMIWGIYLFHFKKFQILQKEKQQYNEYPYNPSLRNTPGITEHSKDNF